MAKGYDRKTCTTCKETKTLSEFGYTNARHVSRRPQCKVCRSRPKKTNSYKLAAIQAAQGKRLTYKRSAARA